MPGRSSATHERHERAVLRAAEVGVDQAAVEFGVTVPRLKVWMEKSQLAPEVVPVPVVDPSELEPESDDPIERLQRLAREQREIAQMANLQTKALLRMGKGTEARNTASAGKYASSATVELERSIREEREHRVRLAELQARVLAEHVRRLLDPLGVRSDGLAPLVRWWLGTLSEVWIDESGAVHSPSCPSDVAESARAALRSTFEGEEIRREVEEGLRRAPVTSEEDETHAREWAETLAAGGEVADVVEPGGVSPVEEIAEDEPKKSLEQEAKEMADRIIARMKVEQLGRETGFGVGSLESRAGGFDVKAPGF